MESLAIAMSSDPIPASLDTVTRAKRGDRSAFEELYRENVARIYALCLRMVRDTHRAEELTQEAFIRAWQKLHGFRGDSAFSTWMHRLAVNVVLSDVRRKNVHFEPFGEGDSPEQLEGTSNNPGHRLDIEAALEHLPEGARTIFILHDIEGFRHSEIAEQLGIATGTAKAQLHRARRILREILQ